MWDLSSPTRDSTLIPCIGRWILNHWTPRKSLTDCWMAFSLAELHFIFLHQKKTYITSAPRINFDGFYQIITCYTASVSYILFSLLVNPLVMHTGGSTCLKNCPLILWGEVKAEPLLELMKMHLSKVGWIPPDLRNLAKLSLWDRGHHSGSTKYLVSGGKIARSRELFYSGLYFGFALFFFKIKSH